MNKILILILLCIITAVGGTILVSKKHWKEKAKTEVKDDFLSVPTYGEAPISTSTISYGNSYWFVVVQDNGGGTMRNSFIEQNHSYFSYAEAKASFKKDCFVLNFIKIDKETYEKNK